jgi:hypothetical protein
MVDGQLRCIGTPQHLKSRFGHGYQLDVTICEDNKFVIDGVTGALHECFDEVQMIEHSQTKLVFEVNSSTSEMTLASMFENLERLKEQSHIGIESYALNQTSLEQIFLKMAKKHEAISQF